MDVAHKKILRALTLEMRHLLEGVWDGGQWVAGDLEQRLRSLGVRQDGSVVPVDELGHLAPHDVAARTVIDAWLTLRREAGGSGAEAVTGLVRETAWSWANRLLALRCMEARGLIDDEVVVTKAVYAGRSLLHHRLVKKNPDLEREEDGGLFFALSQAFTDLHEPLPRAFDPSAPGIALRPSVAALTACIGLLSGTQRPRGQEAASDDVFRAPDALGWAYQYWNTEEKQRVFDRAAGKDHDRVRHKIERADIVPATQLYTEPYMVRFLVQNSLGGLWASMHPRTRLTQDWDYFVRDADRSEVVARPVREITFLDPACGSGHFLLEAFDLFFDMYREEDPDRDATAIVADILTRNLHGLDIDERAVHIAEVALWMKAAERTRAEGREPPLATANLVATNVRLPKGGDHLDRFLARHPEDKPLRAALQVVFDGLEHADELGALLLLDEPVDAALRAIQAKEATEAIETKRSSQLDLLGPGDRSRLPATARTWEEWRADVLMRLRDHFAAEARSADPVQAYFGRSLERGWDVFDLLAQRYDVVAANPPYMGSKNMGPVLRKHVELHFTAGKRDLYAAFILRCRSLLAGGGRAAIVAPQAWLFMRSYVGMRAVWREKDEVFSGLLAEATVEVLAQLGRHAFSEADPPGNVAMFVLHDEAPDDAHEPVCFRLALPRPAEEQAHLLALATRGGIDGLTWRPVQRAFLDIPQAPFCYWLRPRFLSLFAGKTLSRVGEVRQGLATAEDGRFLRFSWEVPSRESRWFPFYKGGGYRKWDGLVNLTVDWEDDGARLRAFPRAVIRNPDVYFKDGWTYSLMARGRMGLRYQAPAGVIGHKGPGIYVKDSAAVACLNSRTVTHMLRAVSPNMAFEVETVSRAPLPDTLPEVDVGELVASKARLTATDPTERAFTGVADLTTTLAWSAELHTLEGAAERAVTAAYGLDEDDVAAVIADTGTPAGWLPSTLATTQRARLRVLFEAGPGGSTNDDEAEVADDEDGEEAADLSTGRPIHPETFLEALCEQIGASPPAVWGALREGMAVGWRCPPEEQRIAADRVSVLVLRLLGHRWPLSVEAGEPCPPWADTDGVVPLTSIPHERPMIERLRDRWIADGVAEGELSAALGLPVDQWLHTRFAAHHTSQFKRRPIAWQLQSGAFTSKKAPAFATLVYAQRIGPHTLASLRSQYAGPLLERRLQEVRTLDSAQRSDAQEQQLRDAKLAAGELKRFIDALTAVELEGFATPELRPIAVQDAIQSLVQPLLARWRDEVSAGPLPRWTADGRAVDERLATALVEANEALPLACARWADLVKAPTWRDVAPSPTSLRQAVLGAAEALAAEASDALRGSVRGAFSVWMRTKREHAKALGKKAPKFTHEKALVEGLEDRIAGWRPSFAELSSFLATVPIFDAWCAEPGRPAPTTLEEFIRQESAWRPDVNDGVRVNLAPLQRAGLLAADALAGKDVVPAIADRAIWRADERRWVRERKLPRPGWWQEGDR